MSSAKPRKPLAGATAATLVMVCSVAVGMFVGIGSVFAGDLTGPTGLAVSLAVNTVGMATALGLCVWWWRRIDEAAREAHKWAWWWGGCTGMSVGAVFLLTALSRDDAGLIDGAMSSATLAMGMGLMLVCQVLGYGIAWIVWWAKRQ